MSHKYLLLTVVIVMVGTASCFPESRVVNGTATDVIKYPFMVSLRVDSRTHFCGGTIIAPRWILTAGHCVYRRSANNMTIEYATTDVSPDGANIVGIKRFILHENFGASKSHLNDIALLELEGSLTYSYKTLAPVTLPESYFEIPQTQEGAPGVLLGWGLNASGGYMQSNLQEVNLKIYSDKECHSRHLGDTGEHEICGGVDEGGKGQCSGDSGGPLLYNGSIQLGIVSWTEMPCGVAPYPGVYTKVSHYIEWIYKHIY